MSSTSCPKLYAFKAGAAIAKGKAVKKGADDQHVIAGAANTDNVIGIAYMAVTNLDSKGAAIEETIEIALPGGGAKGLLGEAVSMGDKLVSHTDGRLVKTNASGDKIIAVAMQDGVENDLIYVEVVSAIATAADQ